MNLVSLWEEVCHTGPPFTSRESTTLTYPVFAVLAIYNRDGSKNGTHSWSASIDNIGLASYIAVQVYELVHGVQFRAILRRMAPFQTLTFALISSDAFLRVLPGAHSLSTDRKTLILDRSALPVLHELMSPTVVPKVAHAVKELGKLRRKSKKVALLGDDAGSGFEDDP
ncbi:hypothetical protein NUW54_g13626 [Trametes sanguinea]|uniref:Uncharacterized protein n=1 Tax=Trametes sanguinea TaxID=158606 RepID=A0ACC1MJD7_9APHY|nr:hypothetical protein NUW54_g13626 [Trametes sanguinea]